MYRSGLWVSAWIVATLPSGGAAQPEGDQGAGDEGEQGGERRELLPGRWGDPGHAAATGVRHGDRGGGGRLDGQRAVLVQVDGADVGEAAGRGGRVREGRAGSEVARRTERPVDGRHV